MLNYGLCVFKRGVAIVGLPENRGGYYLCLKCFA